jgi:SAM-dependent methyltransferase
LELGAGWGFATQELQDRSSGLTVAVDHLQTPLREIRDANVGRAAEDRIQCVRAQAEQLPLADGCCDLVFAQCLFLWVPDAAGVVAEVSRVLRQGGVLAAVEPDYGGLMEDPPEIGLRSVWLDLLRRCGADPLIGRRLPGLFQRAGLVVETRFLDRLEPPDAAYLDLLAELPLTADERQRVDEVRASSSQLAHDPSIFLPFWLVIGEKR